MRPAKRIIKTTSSSSEASRPNLDSPKLSQSFKKSINTINTSFGNSPRQEPFSVEPIDMTVGLTDDDLINMDIKDLNDYLRRLPKNAAATARRRRRLLKNRGYAQSTRSKRMTTIEECTARKTELRSDITVLKREVERLRGVRERLRMTRARLERMQSNGTDVAGLSTSNQIVIDAEDIQDTKDWKFL